MLLETDGSDVTQVVYTLKPAGFGNLILQRRGGADRYYHFDALGSTDRITDSSAAVTDNYIYQAFGEIIASSGTTPNPFRYVGRLGYYYDTDLADYYIRARYYDPVTDRFASRDPIGLQELLELWVQAIRSTRFASSELRWNRKRPWSDVEGGSFYIYAINRPTSLLDPGGLTAEPNCGLSSIPGLPGQPPIIVASVAGARAVVSLVTGNRKGKPVHIPEKCYCAFDEKSDEECKNAAPLTPDKCDYPHKACAAALEIGPGGCWTGVIHSWTLQCLCQNAGKTKNINCYRGCIRCQFESNDGSSPGWDPHLNCLEWCCGTGAFSLPCRAEILVGFRNAINTCIPKESPQGPGFGIGFPPVFVDCKNGVQKPIKPPEIGIGAGI